SAAAWDPDLIQAMGKAIGLEAQSLGVDMVLGPGVNMKRNPLCGRNFEYFSEDPFLAGKLGAAWINGIQSQGIAACLKHFAANN
ncbi:beta-glucosidase, partial [Vibrio parahaemolyticus]|nr:beta-glucosidase [Vibrio parahaemolyticus]